MPQTIQSAQSQPQDYLGPTVVSVLLQALETGVLINQVSRWVVSSWRRQGWLVPLSVAYACLVAL